MKLGILAHGASGAGGQSVAKNLIGALGRVRPDWRFTVTIPEGLGFEPVCATLGHAEVVSRPAVGLIGRYLWETRRLPGLAAEWDADVVLGLADHPLDAAGIPQAVLMHRPTLWYPQRHYAAETLRAKLVFGYYRRWLRRTLGNVSLVLCQTETAERRVRDAFGYTGRVERLPNAVSRFAIAADGPFDLPGPLRGTEGAVRLFCLTRYYAHKNLEVIPRLFQKHGERLRDVVVVTTVAADQHPNAAGYLRAIEQPGVRDHVVNVGPLPQERLAAYYAHCHALFLPTLLESFSGTYLEAMHFGRPILTSDLDFAHEVCGDLADYFDPWDVDAIAAAIERLAVDPAAARRRAEERGGARLATMYRTWDDIADGLADQLEEIARPQRVA